MIADILTPDPLPPFVCECRCGLCYTLEQWRTLDYIGDQRFEDPPYRLELRDCVCGSTHGIWTDMDGNLCKEEL